MFHRIPTIVLAGLLVLVLAASALVQAEIDSTSAEYFGQKEIKEPYKTRITQVLILTSQQNRAIAAAGYKVYTLSEIREPEGDAIKKSYIWTDPNGDRFATTYNSGTGVTAMNADDKYLGKVSPLWLVVILDDRDVKFEIAH